MREILFRGKSGDGWHYGLLTKYGNHKWRVIEEDNNMVTVKTNTIGQYTGLTDKNGTKIFDGDILQGDEYPYCSDGEYNYYAEVVWFDNGCCGFGLCTHKNPKSSVRGISDGNCEWFEAFDSNNWLVIGNIYDNQELVRGEADE
jgi:uncharacterized phage protein (TIGR01671 family)